MKNPIYLVCSLLCAILIACESHPTVIDNPTIGAANTTATEIVKVERTDSTTVLHIHARYRPKYWIQIVSDTYLFAEGNKYMIQSSEGIDLDTKFFMPDSGEATFKLIFPTLPKSAKSFDFIEGDCEECFKVYDIDLTGKREYPDFPQGLPSELRRLPDTTVSLPELPLKSGITQVRVHLLGFKKGMSQELTFYVDEFLSGQTERESTFDEHGVALLSFEQHGLARAYVVHNNQSLGLFYFEPGESLDLYVDLQSLARHRFAQAKYMDTSQLPRTTYSNGRYADVNALLQQSYQVDHDFPIYSGMFGDYNMSAQEYLAYTEKEYLELEESIRQNQELPQSVKEYRQLALQTYFLSALLNGSRILEHNYRTVNNLWDYREKLEWTPPAFDNSRFSIVKKQVNLNNLQLFWADPMGGYLQSLMYPQPVDTKLLTDDTEGILFDLPIVLPTIQKAKEGELKQEDLEKLKALKNPFYAEAAEGIQKEIAVKFEAVKEIDFTPTPEVSNDKLLETILAPHKGKVVFIDFWNTWCGPCMASLKKTEPLKEGELSSEEIVWIYIANQTSPIVNYKTTIRDIKGVHYRLSDEQWAYVTDKLKIDGIPSYVIATRDGKYSLRNDLRDHELMKSTLKELAK